MGLSPDAATLAIDASLADVDEVQLHSGHPGTAGTSNQFGDTTRQPITFAAGSAGVAASDLVAEWDELTAGGTISDVSLWANSEYRGNAQLPSPRTVSLGDPFVVSLVTMTVVPS